jgi:hypothetical protein
MFKTIPFLVQLNFFVKAKCHNSYNYYITLEPKSNDKDPIINLCIGAGHVNSGLATGGAVGEVTWW